jgi:prophage antirepressor-like protein
LEDLVQSFGARDLRALTHNQKISIYINEPGLYDLIMQSKMPVAKKFKSWVTGELLPRIRKAEKEKAIRIAEEKTKALEERLRIAEAEAEIEKKDRSIFNLNDFVYVAQTLRKDEIFYLATTPLYASQNRFKYGGIATAKDLPARLATYNTGRPEGDLYYYTKIIKCHSYKHIERCIELLIKGFKDKKHGTKELMHIRYDCLEEIIEFIVENRGKDIDFINKHAQSFINKTVHETPIVPDPIELGDYIVTTRRRNGASTVIQKINVSEWTEEEIQDLIKKQINEYACVGEQKYDFDTQKDVSPLNIVWKEFIPHFNSYTGKTKKGYQLLTKR